MPNRAAWIVPWLALTAAACAGHGSPPEPQEQACRPHTPASWRTSFGGRLVRHLNGESGSQQAVDDSVDALLGTRAGCDLEERADEILAEYLPDVEALPLADIGLGHVLPTSELPPEYHSLGGHFGTPELLLRTTQHSPEPAVVLSWGNMRHGVIVHAVPPQPLPVGEIVRKISDRTFVVSSETWPRGKFRRR